MKIWRWSTLTDERTLIERIVWGDTTLGEALGMVLLFLTISGGPIIVLFYL